MPSNKNDTYLEINLVSKTKKDQSGKPLVLERTTIDLPGHDTKGQKPTKSSGISMGAIGLFTAVVGIMAAAAYLYFGGNS